MIQDDHCSMVSRAWFESLPGKWIQLGWFHRPDHWNVGLRVFGDGYESALITCSESTEICTEPFKVVRSSIELAEVQDNENFPCWKLSWAGLGASDSGFLYSSFFRVRPADSIRASPEGGFLLPRTCLELRLTVDKFLKEFSWGQPRTTVVNGSSAIEDCLYFLYLPLANKMVLIALDDCGCSDAHGVVVLNGLRRISFDVNRTGIRKMHRVQLDHLEDGNAMLSADDGQIKMTCRNWRYIPTMDQSAMIDEILGSERQGANPSEIHG